MRFREIVTNQLFGFDCIEIPGHTPDQVTFYHQVSKGLFVGDLLIEHMSSNAFVEPDSNGNRPKTLVQQKLSLEKCLTLSVETVQKEKSNKKKILPFVMSTSMLTAAIFGAGS